MNLKKLSALSLAAAAVLLLGQTSAKAQDGGYRFGVGYGYSAGAAQGYGGGINRGAFGFSGGQFRNRPIRSELPYFAQHPPVYYSKQIVRRPYGVSPYAAPPGIMPVEMMVAPEPSVITNPYFRTPTIEPELDGVKTGLESEEKSDQEIDNETVINVRVDNPFFQRVPKADGLALNNPKTVN